MATQMPSSLEIAQRGHLRPVSEIAEELGLPDEYDPTASTRPRSTSPVVERLADSARREARLVTALTDEGGRGGKTTTSVSLTQARRRHIGRRVALSREASLGPVFGIKGGGGRRRLRAGRPMEDLNSTSPATSTRSARPTTCSQAHARGASPARQQARHRPARSAGAAAWTSTTGRSADRARARRSRERLSARPATTSPRPPRSWPSWRLPATCTTCVSASARSPSGTHGRASPSSPSSSRRPAP